MSRQTAVFLIVDRHPVHRTARVKCWLDQNKARIELYFLPSYCLELNPDELLNQDVRSNALGRRRSWNRAEMIGDLRGYLRSTQRRPDIVERFFQDVHVRYAA